MKRFVLPLTILFSFFVFSCEPEEMENKPKAEVQKDERTYSETGNQADAPDPTEKKAP